MTRYCLYYIFILYLYTIYVQDSFKVRMEREQQLLAKVAAKKAAKNGENK